MFKIPFVLYWVRLFFWMPQMKLGYHTVYYDGVWYYVFNAYLFSVQVTTFPVWIDVDEDD